MAYDITRGVCVLFGGEDGSGPGRRHLGMGRHRLDTAHHGGGAECPRQPCDDLRRGARVASCCSAVTTANAQLGDTWEYDGIGWSQVLTDGGPPARVDAQLAFDTQRGRSVLFGGSDTVIDRNDTWEYDGSRWQQVFTLVRPQGNAAMGMAYDSSRGRTVVFRRLRTGSGRSPTPGNFGAVGATVRTFGTGCVGGAGRTPRLSPGGGAGPRHHDARRPRRPAGGRRGRPTSRSAPATRAGSVRRCRSTCRRSAWSAAAATRRPMPASC